MQRKHWYILIFLLAPALSWLLPPAPAAAREVPALVSTEWLQLHLNDPGLVVVEVRTETNYGFAHIPGAVSAPYLSLEPFNEKHQCLLMPTPADLTALMQKLGVNNDSWIVIYDHGNTESDATKGGAAVWIMEAMGHDKVSYLNGGFTKWTFEGRLIDNKKLTPKPGNFMAKPDPSKVATIQEMADNLKSKEWVMVDDRNALQYFGTTKHPEAQRFGHLPGALNFPAAFMTNAGANRAPATVPSEKNLEAMARGVGIPTDRNTKIITYCNSGQQSGWAYFILHDVLGYKQVKAYDGSIIEYSAAANLPLVKYSWDMPGR